MASRAPITAVPASEPAFVLNGTTPLIAEADEYVAGAHAILTCMTVAAGETDNKLAQTDGLTIAALDGVALLLAHAAKLMADAN